MDEPRDGPARPSANPASGGPPGAPPPPVARWRPELPGDRLLLPEPWLEALYGEGAAGEPAGGEGAHWMAYIAERVPTGRSAPPAPPTPPATAATPARHDARAAAAPWPRILVVPTGGDEAAALLAGAGAGAPPGGSFDGLVLAEPADLERLLARRPELTRPRGGRPAWVLLLLRQDDAPGPWARGWARVAAWSPAALPPVVVPEGLLAGRVQVPAGRLWRARLALLRALEEPVPVPVAWPRRSPGGPVGGEHGQEERAGGVPARGAGPEDPDAVAFAEHRQEQQAPVWWLVR